MNFRFLLFPFSLPYAFIVWARNLFYDFGIFRQTTFDVPVINVGNLTVGGTGKTPHIEYLIQLLGAKNIAVLSRGYRRKSKGFLYVETNSSVSDVGDEPVQIKSKFNNCVVAVCEERKTGIENILAEHKTIDVILLDDAFQHRAVKPSLNILLMDFNKALLPAVPLPAGNYREVFSSKKRADIIVISKAPLMMRDAVKEKFITRIKPAENQQLFFSGLVYGKPVSVFSGKNLEWNKSLHVLLVSGIADATLFENFVETNFTLEKHLAFSDHHLFTEHEIETIEKLFSNITAEKKIILTTEKDSVRLKSMTALQKLPLYYLPVEVKFHKQDEEKFNKIIQEHVGKNKRNG